MTKQEISCILEESEKACYIKRKEITDTASVTDYSHLVTENGCGEKIWSKAFTAALSEHGKILIPASAVPYYIDKTIVVPSDRVIEAEVGAVIKRATGFMCLMLRNEHNADGSLLPEPDDNRDCNISVIGGIWDGGCDRYTKNLYDDCGSFNGVSACIFINHADYVTVKDVTVKNAGEFAIQTGDITNALFENLHFDDCHADGLHIGGKTHLVTAKDISGNVGDDLVALNAFDWERSSVNFGSISCVLCEKLCLSEEGKYKAFRIQPGKYFYSDGSVSNCAITDVIIKNVRGINTYKMYFQRDVHNVDEEPTYGAPGTADSIYFEDIEAKLEKPIDLLEPYVSGNPVNGHFSVFELGSEIGKLTFENIRVNIDKQMNPMSFFIQVGAKSVRIDDREIFDPRIGGNVKEIELSDIYINGKALTEDDIDRYICEITFNNIYGDGKSSSIGKIKKIKFK